MATRLGSRSPFRLIVISAFAGLAATACSSTPETRAPIQNTQASAADLQAMDMRDLLATADRHIIAIYQELARQQQLAASFNESCKDGCCNPKVVEKAAPSGVSAPFIPGMATVGAAVNGLANTMDEIRKRQKSPK